MNPRIAQALRRWWPLLLFLLLPAGWLLPLSGQIMVVQEAEAAFPQIRLDPAIPRPGRPLTIRVRDEVPWAHVQLTVNNQPADWIGATRNPDGTVSWEWSVTAPNEAINTVIFYHDCHNGCVERGRKQLEREEMLMRPDPLAIPTKLGVVFPDPARDWHGRSGWAVELSYARLGDEGYWGADQLAARVQRATEKGLRVLVRVDYDQGQSLPPVGDGEGLQFYLQYLQRLAQDDRLQEVYGYIIGSGYNSSGSNRLAPEHPVTAEWYARLLNGYGERPDRGDNVVQMLRAVNPRARVLVGPVQPWNTDQDGEVIYRKGAPWLNYFNTLVMAIDQSARDKSASGIALAAPDGFALQVPGRPDAPELAGRDPASEPRLSLARPEWGGAQAGFRLFEEWLAIINAYPTTRGLPAYITSTNTFTPDGGIPPAENYPPGWLTSALEVVNGEPQIQALCWFIDRDGSGDNRWEPFSLAQQVGRLAPAAEEFDALLQAR